MRAFLEMKGNRPNVSATASHTKHKGVVPLRYAPYMEPFRASGAGSMTPQRRKNGVPKGSRPGRDAALSSRRTPKTEGNSRSLPTLLDNGSGQAGSELAKTVRRSVNASGAQTTRWARDDTAETPRPRRSRGRRRAQRNAELQGVRESTQALRSSG